MPTRLIANWKMQLTTAQAVSLARQVRRRKTKATIVLCPSFPALASVATVVKGSTLKLGAQTMGPDTAGAFTGEISPLDLKSLGVKFVILGHSDRRKLGETNQQVATKVRLALATGLTPILCVGETAPEYKAGRSKAVVQKQLQTVWSKLKPAQKRQVWVAYEPVWAISPGGPIEPAQAHAMVRFIWSITKQRRPLIYGGSVTPQNARQYLDGRHCDGVLVGKASLKASSLLALAKH